MDPIHLSQVIKNVRQCFGFPYPDAVGYYNAQNSRHRSRREHEGPGAARNAVRSSVDGPARSSQLFDARAVGRQDTRVEDGNLLKFLGFFQMCFRNRFPSVSNSSTLPPGLIERLRSWAIVGNVDAIVWIDFEKPQRDKATRGGALQERGRDSCPTIFLGLTAGPIPRLLAFSSMQRNAQRRLAFL